jgi:outer membrane autotransporter protein
VRRIINRSVLVVPAALLVCAGTAQAVTDCTVGLGNPWTIDGGNTCTTADTTEPSTVQFQGAGTLNLVLNAPPSGAVTTTVDGSGAVVVQADVISAANYGVAGSGDLLSVTVDNAATFSLGHNLAAITFTNNGTVNQSAGTLTATTLAIGAGDTFTQSGTGIINATNTTIGAGGTLTLVNQGTGAIDGAAAGQGALVLGGNYNTDSALGGTNSLASITVNGGTTLSLDQNAAATTFTNNGTVNQSAGTLTATTLAIGAADTFTQSGTGIINATNTTIGTGGALTLVNQGTGAIDGAAAGQGALVFGGNYNTDSALGGTNSLASITVNGGTTLSLDQNAAATTFTNNGTVNQSAGTLTATTLAIGAADTFTQSGTGIINATNTTIGAGGTLTLVNQGTGAIDGAAAGQGALVFGGNYNTDSALGGTNSLASITVNGGTTLTLDQNAAVTAMSIAGIVNKSTASGITATTTIQDTGTLNVASGFTHTGNVVLGGGAGGTLDLGTATLNVTGAFAMNAGSTFETTINSATDDDAGRIVSTGLATVAAGTTLNLTVTDAAAGSTYKIIDGAAGGAVSVPTTIIDDFAALDFTASTDGNDLTLTAAFATTLTAGLSPNAMAVNSSLPALLAADAALNAAFNGLTTSAQMESALQSLAPNMSGAVTHASLASLDLSIDVVDDRLTAARSGGGTLTGLASGDNKGYSGMWIKGVGSSIDQDDHNGVSGYRADIVGAALGADTSVNNNLQLGVALGYTTTDADTNGGSSDLDITSYHLSLYGSYERDHLFLDTIASYARNEYDSKRHIQVGAVARVADADFDGNQFSLKAKLGRNYELNRGVVVAPYVSLHYTNLDLDSYTESGAGTANLSVRSEDYNSLRSELGLSVGWEYTGSGIRYMPELHASWGHEHQDDKQVNTSTFSIGGAAFTTGGIDTKDSSLKAGASLGIFTKNNMDVRVSYDYMRKEEYGQHTGSLVASILF